MSSIGYFGGVVLSRPVSSPAEAGEQAIKGSWVSSRGGRRLFLRTQGDLFRIVTHGTVAMLLRGHAAQGASSGPMQPAQLMDFVLPHYRKYGDLPVDYLEGSFTLILMDGEAGRVLLYRNLVGTGFTYYTQIGGGLLFAANLADLLDGLDVSPRLNSEVLPSFFLFRFVPGRRTLFQGIERLLPGELVTFGSDGLQRAQRQTLGGLVEGDRIYRDAPERIDAVTTEVLGDCVATYPKIANLLSGGVDSSYLQFYWNRVARSDECPRSYAVSVDHTQTRDEAAYAVSAAELLGVSHTFVPADGDYADYLLDSIAGSAEPPHHVQSAYFPLLARTMSEQGISAGLCGQGADALFGLEGTTALQNALLIRALVPFPGFRGWLSRLGTAIHVRRVSKYFGMSLRVDDLTDPQHPTNQVGAFTDWHSVTSCFGSAAVARALAERRDLLSLHSVKGDQVELFHACDFLSDSTDSASLWATLFNWGGSEMICPYLDSRIIRAAVNLDPRVRFPFRCPKKLLKEVLSSQVGRELGYRPKLSFGQPIFEWLAPEGQLRPLVDAIDLHDFVDEKALKAARDRPNWFLYNLLCYDLWHKLFISKSVSREGNSKKCLRFVNTYGT